jgi:N-acetylglucosaminyldiphosphoundecaprenol N-acetyl-beta-D-mannosaminyltransferase
VESEVVIGPRRGEGSPGTELRPTAEADGRGGSSIEPELSPAHEITSIMGLPLDAIDQETLVRLVVERASAGEGGWVVTPNLDILRRFRSCRESRDLILGASHRVADGQPIVWASRLAGMPLPERVTGSDLARSLPRAAARAGLSVFLLGGNPGVAAAAARRLRSRFPGLLQVHSHCPPFGFGDDSDELERIRAILLRTRPALVLVGLGFPKQERLIRALRTELPGTWFVGVGIALSFLAGEQPRAPAGLQRLGLEWMYRLVREPRRLFRRYIVQDAPFAPRLLGWALAHRLFGAARDGDGAQETRS